MIKTLSPYNISIPFVSPLTGLTCSQYTLKLYVWDGDKIDIPALPSYEITKTNPEALTSSDNINIGQLVNSFISFVPRNVIVTGLINGGNQVWVKASVFYTTTDPTELLVPQEQFTELAIKGWGTGIGGENQDVPANKVLMQTREFKVNTTSRVIVPILIDEPVVATPEIIITDVVLDTGLDYIITFTIVGSYSILDARIYPSVGVPYISSVSGITSTQTVTIQATTGLTGFQLFGFETNTSTNIFSNIFQITI